MEKCSLAPESRQSQRATAYVTIQWSADRSSSSSNSGASQSINTVCVTLETDSLWKGDLNYCSEKKFFFLAFLSKKVKIYIYIKHRYKKVSSTSCVWQHLLHREVPLILRCKDQAHFCCESKYQKWWELHILCWPFFWKDHTLFPSLLTKEPPWDGFSSDGQPAPLPRFMLAIPGDTSWAEKHREGLGTDMSEACFFPTECRTPWCVIHDSCHLGGWFQTLCWGLITHSAWGFTW